MYRSREDRLVYKKAELSDWILLSRPAVEQRRAQAFGSLWTDMLRQRGKRSYVREDQRITTGDRINIDKGDRCPASLVQVGNKSVGDNGVARIRGVNSIQGE